MIFLLFRIFPYLAVPTIILCLEMGIVFRRKRKPDQHLFWAGAVMLSFLVFLWIFFRGDLNSDLWLKTIFF